MNSQGIGLGRYAPISFPRLVNLALPSLQGITSASRMIQTFYRIEALERRFGRAITRPSYWDTFGAGPHSLTATLNIPWLSLPGSRSFGLMSEVFKAQEKMKRTMDAWDADRVYCQKQLWQHGWMLDIDKADLRRVASVLKSGEHTVEDFEDSLVEFYEACIDELLADCHRLSPTRTPQLFEAIDNHQRGHYFASISTMLPVVEGLSLDLFGQSFFQMREGTAILAKKLDPAKEPYYVKFLLTPLEEPGPLNAGPERQGAHTNALNRHMVTHGQDVKFGTRVNSAKAISVVRFLLWVFKMKREALVWTQEMKTP